MIEVKSWRGIKEGRKEGRKQGRKEGRKQGKSNQHSYVFDMGKDFGNVSLKRTPRQNFMFFLFSFFEKKNGGQIFENLPRLKL